MKKDCLQCLGFDRVTLIVLVSGFLYACSTPVNVRSLVFRAGEGSSVISRYGSDSSAAEARSFRNAPDAVPVELPIHEPSLRPYVRNGKRYVPLGPDQKYSARGVASWYGPKFHGRKTASGERYDMYAMTAAHTILPLPSFARVTLLRTGRSVVVKVNDRGPFHAGRIIDLSFAAAAKLGIIGKGSDEILVERVFANRSGSRRGDVSYFENADILEINRFFLSNDPFEDGYGFLGEVYVLAELDERRGDLFNESLRNYFPIRNVSSLSRVSRFSRQTHVRSGLSGFGKYLKSKFGDPRRLALAYGPYRVDLLYEQKLFFQNKRYFNQLNKAHRIV